MSLVVLLMALVVLVMALVGLWVVLAALSVEQKVGFYNYAVTRTHVARDYKGVKQRPIYT